MWQTLTSSRRGRWTVGLSLFLLAAVSSSYLGDWWEARRATPGLTGKYRSQLVSEFSNACIDAQVADPANAKLSRPQLVKYCACSAEELASRWSNAGAVQLSKEPNDEKRLAIVKDDFAAASATCAQRIAN
jgi:hypothetical protein